MFQQNEGRKMKKYLITMGHYGSAKVINHGLVEIDDDLYVNGETPVEDFGCFYYRNEPFPENEDECFNIFMELMEKDYANDMELFEKEENERKVTCGN
jgi:hypothetical protein